MDSSACISIDHAPDLEVRRAGARRHASACYQRSACLPTTKPNIDMRPIASAYQIATNSGESFVQCIAKTVAPKPPKIG